MTDETETHAAENPNAVILAALAANAERHRALTESIFGPAEPETPDQEEGDE